MASNLVVIRCLFLAIFLHLKGLDSSSTFGVRVKLVHFDSPVSPHHVKYGNIGQRVKVLTQISERRLANILRDHLMDRKESYVDDIPMYYLDLNLDPAGVFLASVGIGTPVKPQLLAIDTGSTITWVGCGRLRNMPQGTYDYRMSSTSKEVTCGDYHCENLPKLTQVACDFPFQKCGFYFGYMSSSTNIGGYLVTDIFTLLDSGPNGENITLDWRPHFGCGYLNGPLHQRFSGTGVLGLSNQLASMATQLGLSFSYCIGNIYNTSYDFNSLMLGKGLLLGKSTPILNYDTRVYVNLQSIAVDGDDLGIDPMIFRRDLNKLKGGTILDSGSAITYLNNDAYIVLKSRLIEKMKPVLDDLCFYKLEPSRVPVVEFIFEDGATLTLGIDALFLPDFDMKCFLGIMPVSRSSIAGERDLTLIGINAQQYHNMGFDYHRHRVYMHMTECDGIYGS